MKKPDNQIAIWVGEVISDTDNANKINTKLEEYFNAGVQVVWNIYPASKQVYVYKAIDEVTQEIARKAREEKEDDSSTPQ